MGLDDEMQKGCSAFERSLAASFIDDSIDSDERFQSRVIANSRTMGESLLSAIKQQLNSCDSFDFCVAFVAESGLSCLVQVLAELRAKKYTR